MAPVLSKRPNRIWISYDCRLGTAKSKRWASVTQLKLRCEWAPRKFSISFPFNTPKSTCFRGGESCPGTRSFYPSRKIADSETAFSTAQARLRSTIGISASEEFIRLSNGVDQAWTRLTQARVVLDQHIRKHGCRVG
jgi:hypothetical protein